MENTFIYENQIFHSNSLKNKTKGLFYSSGYSLNKSDINFLSKKSLSKVQNKNLKQNKNSRSNILFLSDQEIFSKKNKNQINLKKMNFKNDLNKLNISKNEQTNSVEFFSKNNLKNLNFSFSPLMVCNKSIKSEVLLNKYQTKVKEIKLFKKRFIHSFSLDKDEVLIKKSKRNDNKIYSQESMNSQNVLKNKSSEKKKINIADSMNDLDYCDEFLDNYYEIYDEIDQNIKNFNLNHSSHLKNLNHENKKINYNLKLDKKLDNNNLNFSFGLHPGHSFDKSEKFNSKKNEVNHNSLDSLLQIEKKN